MLFGVDLISGERKRTKWFYYTKKYNRTPNQGEIVAHAPLLDYELEKLNPKLIVTLGNIGLQRLTGKGKNHRCTRAIIKTAHSKIKGYTKCRIYMVRERISYFSDLPSCFHFYNRGLLELIYEDLEKLKQYVIKTRKAKSFSSCVYVCNGFYFHPT